MNRQPTKLRAQCTLHRYRGIGPWFVCGLRVTRPRQAAGNVLCLELHSDTSTERVQTAAAHLKGL